MTKSDNAILSSFVFIFVIGIGFGFYLKKDYTETKNSNICITGTNIDSSGIKAAIYYTQDRFYRSFGEPDSITHAIQLDENRYWVSGFFIAERTTQKRTPYNVVILYDTLTRKWTFEKMIFASVRDAESFSLPDYTIDITLNNSIKIAKVK